MTPSATTATWREVGFDDLATVRSGQVDPQDPAYRDLPLIAPDHLESGSGRLLEVKSAASQGAISGKYVVEPGDIVYSKIRPHLQKAFLCGFKALCSADMYPLAPGPDTDPTFLLNILLSKHFTDYATSASARSGIPKINRVELAGYRVLIPALEEQRAIGHALQDAADLVAQLEAAIAKKEAIKRGMFQQLLTGRARLPGFTKPWVMRRLADMLSYEQPGAFLVSTAKQLEVGRIPVLTAGKTFVLGYTNDDHGIYTNHPVIIFDDFTTASKFVDFDFKAKSSAMKILTARPEFDARFLYERMQLIDFSLADHKRHWISEYSQQEISVPDHTEQQAISGVIADCSQEISVLRKRLTKARAVKQGMMQELLTGRTRLPAAKEAA